MCRCIRDLDNGRQEAPLVPRGEEPGVVLGGHTERPHPQEVRFSTFDTNILAVNKLRFVCI